MKENKELLLDLLFRKKRELTLYVKELSSSLGDADEASIPFYEGQISENKDIIGFLSKVMSFVRNKNNAGIDYLNKYIKENKDTEKSALISINVSKVQILKALLKDYKTEYRKNYWNNKSVGLNGIFDNDLFCSIIKKRIDRYVYCNNVTRTKYKHLVAFLTEFLHEMENSDNPLKTLKYKLKLYQRYKKTELVEIRQHQMSKYDVVKEILEEYKKEKKNRLGM
jgi:hypothetical protein